MEFERPQKQILFWLAWVLANMTGLAFGWAVGEMLGQFVGRTVNWAAGITLAWVVFEIILWLMRILLLYYVKEFSAWKPIDIIIWVVAEAFGWFIGEGFYEVVGPVWVTAGPVWGVLLGAQCWIIIWLIRQSKPARQWWPVTTAFWAFFGIIGGGLFTGLALTISLEIGEAASTAIHPFVGWAMSGATLGCFIGGITGIAFVKLLRGQPFFKPIIR